MAYGKKIVREKEKMQNEKRCFCDMWATATSYEL